MLTQNDIAALAEKYLNEVLSDDESFRALYRSTNEHGIASELQTLEERRILTFEALTKGEFFPRREGHEHFIKENCNSLLEEGNTIERCKLERELLKQDLEICRIETERIKGNYANGYDNRIPTVPSTLTSAITSTNISISLSDAIDKYIADYRRNRNAADTSIREYESICRLFQSAMGNKALSAITRDNIRDFHNDLKHFPKNVNKLPAYRNKTFAEIISMNVDSSKVLSGTSIDKYMVRIISFLDWAENEGWINKNPATGIWQSKKKAKGPQKLGWKPFDTNDLARMVRGFVTEAEKGELKGRPERVWIPLIGLFSGARVNEIAQLQIEDLLQEHETGIWYFKIEEDTEGKKRVKTAAANRAVPVHPQLIELGLIHYYKKMKASGANRLWVNLTKSKATEKWHKNFVNWFLKTSRNAGFKNTYMTDDQQKVFHSFRKSFTNALKQKMVAESVIKDIVGHSQGSITFDTYTLPYSLKTMLSEMNKIDFVVDFSPLKAAIEGVETAKKETRGKRVTS